MDALLGFPQTNPSVIFEDNQSVLDIMIRGQVSSGVSRYITAKYYYTRNLINQGVVRLVYCPTTIMIADIVTKNLPGPLFKSIKSILLNNNLLMAGRYQELVDNLNVNSEEYLNNLILNLVLCNI